MKITKRGIYFDIAAADYFADPCPQPSLTQSIAKVLLDHSPEHAKQEHPRLAPPDADEADEKYDKAKAIGNAAHLAMIGRGKRIAVGKFNDWKRGEAQQFKAEALAAGHEPILEKHMKEAIALVAAARNRLDAAGWQDAFRDGHGEVVLIWEEDGIWLRTMIDWLSVDQRLIYDLKSSGGSIAPHVVGQKIADDGWDIQAAMQERGLAKLDPDNAGRLLHRFVAVENWKPYGLVPIELTEHHLTMGRKKLAIAMELWRLCMTSGKWPGYPSRVVRPEYPGYAETRWLEREADYHDSGITGAAYWEPGELIKPAEPVS